MSRIIILTIMCLYGFTLSAASIERIYKKRKVVRIDSGRNSGVKKGTRVCFYKKTRKVGCGSVVKVMKSKAMVKVKSSKRFARLRKGFRAEIGGASSLGKVVSSSSGRGSGDSLSSGLRISFIPTLLPTVSYNKLGYNSPDSANPSGLSTLWTEEGTSTDMMASLSTLLTVSGDFRLGLSSTSALIVGARYRDTLQGYTGRFNYTNETTQQAAETFVEILQTMSSIGVYADYLYYLIPMGSSGSLSLTSGLDFDMAKHALTANKRTDAGDSEVIAILDNSINIISLRLGAHGNYYFGESLGLGLGLNLLVPITTMGASDEAEVTSDHASGLSVDPNQDIIDAVSFGAASFGMEMLISILYDF